MPKLDIEVDKTWKMIRDSTTFYNPYEQQTKRVIIVGTGVSEVVKILTKSSASGESQPVL